MDHYTSVIEEAGHNQAGGDDIQGHQGLDGAAVGRFFGWKDSKSASGNESQSVNDTEDMKYYGTHFHGRWTVGRWTGWYQVDDEEDQLKLWVFFKDCHSTSMYALYAVPIIAIVPRYKQTL